MSETIVIIGAGHGAAQLVESLRSGGCADRIVLIGDEPYRPYERPATSKELLSGGIELDRVFLKRETYYGDKQIELRLATRVTAIDRSAKTVTLRDGETLAYDTLVIATGARARRLQVPGVDLDGIFYLRTLADSRATGDRRRRLCRTGGGGQRPQAGL
jgi:3-phenylpropionate/trans-cinnamate dioxygenase ferredoxin reductase subunit